MYPVLISLKGRVNRLDMVAHTYIPITHPSESLTICERGWVEECDKCEVQMANWLLNIL